MGHWPNYTAHYHFGPEITLDKHANLKIILITTQQKHMFKLMDKQIIPIWQKKIAYVELCQSEYFILSSHNSLSPSVVCL